MNDLITKQNIMDIVADRYPISDASEYEVGYADALNDVLKDVRYLPSVESEILSEFKSILFGIGEICVDVSKCNITAEEGIQQIRDKYLDIMYRKVVQNE
jgi:hypothetical protein